MKIQIHKVIKESRDWEMDIKTDINQVLEGLDALFAKKEMDKVEPYLQGHLKTFMEVGDASAVITTVNELIGFYRSMGEHEKSIFYCEQILSFMQMCKLEGTVPYATTLLNVATANRAAGKLSEAREYYEQVKEIYKEHLSETDYRFAGLYNNMSLLYEELTDYEKAVKALEKALEIIKLYGEQTRIELATTYTNLAACYIKWANKASNGDSTDKPQEATSQRETNKITNNQTTDKQATNNQSIEKQEAFNQAEVYAIKAQETFGKEGEMDYHYGALLAILGEISYKKGDYQLATANYEKALVSVYTNMGRNQTYENIHKSLNQVYKEMGIEIPENGMELSREFYEQVGKPMLLEKFPEHFDHMTIGLIGEGSDCFGFDDKISKDHDFGPGFCIWITDALYEQIGKELEEAYANLPLIYKGILRMTTKEGQGRVGVFKIGAFYKKLLGVPVIPDSIEDWAAIDEYRLATAVNGEIFKDSPNGFSMIREKLLTYYPTGLWIGKIAREAVQISQSGQYNYGRMMLRGDLVTGEIAIGEFIKHVLQMVYLLNRTYAPYYKWMNKGLKKLSWGEEVGELLEQLVSLKSQQEAWINLTAEEMVGKINEKDEKVVIIEKICTLILEKLKEEKLATGNDNYLEHHVNEFYAYGMTE